ncbi:glycosyltransferase family 1 protein [Erythrobacter sp. T5W1-R]|uniref:glycosyltransferase family 4 protein n=1 Tax=Erythrobacter sp. T5W1-R TaxID=3101752 RepID=UPI002AFED84F|nr:glycosyltransferase family 1 protein [Erythrobacter sp. T5W1-R]MEA1619908.1 glycosyltransferase family 1 protein [Erythrobacter sp. T5W1-R]
MADKENSAPLLLDVTRLIWRRWEGVRPTGIDRICDAWLEHFAPRSQAVIIMRRRQVILPLRASQALFAALIAGGRAGASVATFRRDLILIALRWGWRLLRTLDGKGRYWLNPGHTGLHIPGLAAWVRQSDVRPVYLIHDLIPITHPETCRAGEDAKHTARMLTALQTGAGIIANSQDTLDTLANFASGDGLPLPPACVAWPGYERLQVEPDAAPSSPPHTATFVILGTIEGRKNHALLLSVWRRMLADLGAQCPQLIIIGRRGWQADEVSATLDTHDFQGKVVEMGALDDAALASILRDARALLFPSLAEGFGMPLIEALAAGIPVIASDLAVFREIAGDVPELLSPQDEAAWRTTILDYASPTSALRERQMALLGTFAPPTWDQHFVQLEEFLGRIAKG